MRRGEQYVVERPDGTWETRTVNWWTEAQYHPWNHWTTSHHMIWAVPTALFVLFATSAVLVAILKAAGIQ